MISRKFHEKENMTGVKRKIERERRVSARIPRDFRKLRNTKISLAKYEESVDYEKPVNDETVYERKRSSGRETRRRCRATRGVVN